MRLEEVALVKPALMSLCSGSAFFGLPVAAGQAPESVPQYGRDRRSSSTIASTSPDIWWRQPPVGATGPASPSSPSSWYRASNA